MADNVGKVRVAIVGAGKKLPYPHREMAAYRKYLGPSGLAMLKQLRADGFSAVLFERRSSVGGLWAYSENKADTTTLPRRSFIHWPLVHATNTTQGHVQISASSRVDLVIIPYQTVSFLGSHRYIRQ